MKKEETKLTKEQEKELLNGSFEIARLEVELKKAELKAKIKKLERDSFIVVGIEQCETCDECCEKENKPSFFGNIFKK